MSCYITIQNPPMELLRHMLQLEYENSGDCPGCGATIGKPHEEGCDVARCRECGGQLLSCNCDTPTNTTWIGLWPGVMYCYENNLVAYDTTRNTMIFDLNEAAIHQASKKEKT